MGGMLRGRYQARFAQTPGDIEAAQRLRYLAFRAENAHSIECEAEDADAFDDLCHHVLVEDSRTGQLVCCYRLMALAHGREINRSYSAQYYDLSGLESYEGSLVEMGRFCIHPDHRSADVLRVAWGAMTAYVDANGVDLLFGCSSFHGTVGDAYLEAFALLKDRHLAPTRWLPRVKAPSVFRFASKLRLRKPNLKAAMRVMPPLLRTYLVMGGWVSDHAVVDRDLGTLHVFTGLEVKHVPEGRLRLLRAGLG